MIFHDSRLFLLAALLFVSFACTDVVLERPQRVIVDDVLIDTIYPDVDPSCSDRIQNNDESDVDCGGSMCSACGEGQTCRAAGDCLGNLCVNGLCQAVSACENGRQDGNETDTDCGGSDCPKCRDYKLCRSNSDCAGGTCADGWCATASCVDGVQNNDESDVDCGGLTCIGCSVYQRCRQNDDCLDNLCFNGFCEAVNSCANGIRDNRETDIDCGGDQCEPCWEGARCQVGSDCWTGLCQDGVCGGGGSSCWNGWQDGQETDVDCGGRECQPCWEGQRCFEPKDCMSGACNNGVCGAGDTCWNGWQDGSESDVDCGGWQCEPCWDGQHCLGGQDCWSGVCANSVCGGGGGTCWNGWQDGSESDVDCGGGQCDPCWDGARCYGPQDCWNGVCPTASAAAATPAGTAGRTARRPTSIAAAGTVSRVGTDKAASSPRTA
ncbi:MAG: hypothetical protein CO108_19275 [Deltaproteobacteria bacterium CG_4_9_14_3_um_filter_63_12]|nr:MAG: hypothetical protein CO108_19275 [Deltaproteobacteria bacterium CG_4_9_14_3_um_filter_63_12]